MRDQTHQFFEALYSDKPDNAAVCVWRLADKRSAWFVDPAKAADYAIAHRELDLYAQIGVGPLGSAGQRLKADQVTGIPALWIDFDLEGQAHQKKNLPRTVTEALAILPPELPPSMIVATGYGAHAYWLLKEMFLIESDEDRLRVALALERWQRLIRLRAQIHGWTVDATHDLSRVLRIPGTKNNKRAEDGLIADCELVALYDRRSNLSEFEEFLAGIPSVTQNAENVARQLAMPIPELDSLILTSDRRFAKLSFFLNNERFAATWNHQRPDFNDQSQSAYDQSIADILYDAGLTEQEIVDAMIHNRSLRGDKVRTKLEFSYFRKTLGKARNQLKHGGAASSGGDAPPPKPLTDEEKGAMAETLSNMLNLDNPDGSSNIQRVVKMTGDKPTWRIELNDGRSITIRSAEALLNKHAVRAAILAATNRVMRRYREENWDAVLAAIGAATIEIPAGLESTATGEMHQLLERYLRAIGVKRSAKEALNDPRWMFMPFEIGGRIAVNAVDFQEWVDRQLNKKFEISDLANRFSVIKADSEDFTDDSGRQQSRWILPPCFEPAFWRRAAARAAQASTGHSTDTDEDRVQ